MRFKALMLCSAAWLQTMVVSGQSPIFPTPPRVFGQLPDPATAGASRSYAPNLVEGRELYAPQSAALDATANVLYVADTGNNRVLAWRNPQAAGANLADLVIGQPDRFSTAGNNPNLRSGLNQPSALAVDRDGNLYVLDAGNHRIVRFPKPFQPATPGEQPRADAVIGQPGFNAADRQPNNGGISARSLSFAAGAAVLPGALVLDAAGNLWTTDPANNRVLMYSKDQLDRAATQQVEASLVLGQQDFSSREDAPQFSALNRLRTPVALALDGDGRLYVADLWSRILVFEPPFQSGEAAQKGAGVVASNGQPLSPPTNRSFRVPQGLAAAGNELIVSDTGNNRLLRFDVASLWPGTASPEAKGVIGQADFVQNTPRNPSEGVNTPMHAVAAGGSLYVADAQNNRVVIWPLSSGGVTRAIGQLGPEYNGANLVEGKELFLAAGGSSTIASGGLAIDTRVEAPRLYIADMFNNRVLGYCDTRKAKPGDLPDLVIGQPNVLQTRANYTASGVPTQTESNLSSPAGLAVDAGGNLFVADSVNARVLRFPEPCANPRGPHKANLVLGQADFFTRDVSTVSARFMGVPYGVAVLPDQHVLVSDRAYNRVLMFRKPAGGDFASGQAAEMVVGQQDFTSSVSGNTLNRFRDPRYIATDTSGRLYVADSQNNRVLVFSLAEAGPTDATASVVVTAALSGSLQRTHGMYLDPNDGELWVTDFNPDLARGEGRVLRYPEYVNLGFNPVANLSLRTVTMPSAIALDGKGKMFVAELGNRLSLYVPSAVATDNGNWVSNRELVPGLMSTLWPGPTWSYLPAGFGINSEQFDWFSPPKIPLPNTLSDVRLLLNGNPVPLYHAHNGQINFQVPKNAPTSGTAELQLVRASTGEILRAGSVRMKHAQPEFLMRTSAPFLPGQVVAQHPADNPITCNGPEGPPIAEFCPGGTRPARRGEFVTFYMIGTGAFAGMPDDGAQAAGATPTDGNLVFVIGPARAEVQYSGTAPGLIGIWQVNAKVPDNAPPGQVPVGVQYRDVTNMFNRDPRNTQDLPDPFITVR